MELAIAGGILKAVLPPVATVVVNAAKNKLNPSELQIAIEAGLHEAEALKLEQKIQNVFYRCDDKQTSDFLKKLLEHPGVQRELQKPLNDEGMPEVAYLVEAAKQAAGNIPIAEDALEPWLTVFAQAYFEKTSAFLSYQVAKVDYLTQLVKQFDKVRFLGVAVESGEIEQAEQLVKIFVPQDVLEEKLTFGSDFFLRFSDGSDPSGISSAARQSQLLQEQQFRSQLDRTGRRFSADQLRTQTRSKAVLLGAPGSGKTTLMSYFAVTLAREAIAASTPPEMLLPILIRIRDWALHPELSIAEFARFHAEKTMSVKPLPQGFFEYWLDRGQALILLDGLDEVVVETKRSHLVQCIENFLGQYRLNRAIVTSRPAGYRRDFFRTEEFPHYELQPFNDEQMNLFIDKWYDSRVPDKAEAERRKDSLKKAFEGKDRIKLLARNPLLLTIVALIHRYQVVLPKQRHKLYDKAVDTLLLNWDENKELTNHEKLKYLELDDLRRLMESVAYWVHSQGNTGDREGGTVIDRDELMEQIRKIIQQQKPDLKLHYAREEAKRFVDFIRERTGLLNEQGQECYAFVHKTFQEYLTAQEINYQRDNDDFEIVLTHIENHLHDPHWREVLLLMIAQQAPKKAALAIRKILDANSPYEQWLHRDLLFAGRCLAENVKGLKAIDPKLSSEILEPLLELEVSNDEQIGERIRFQVLKVLCSLSETEFEAETLQLIKNKVDKIKEDRLREYRLQLGEQTAIITELLQLLDNEDIRASVIQTLGGLGNSSTSVIQALLQQLDDEDPGVRWRTADTLRRLGNGSELIVQALLQRLDDQDLGVRSRVSYALRELATASHLDPVIQALLQQLNNQDWDIQSNTAYTLGRLGNTSEPVVQALLRRLGDKDSAVRSRAAFELGNLDNAPEPVIQALMQRLDDSSPLVRSNAAYTLCKLDSVSEPVTKALLRQLDDGDSNVRLSAAYTLGRSGNASELVIQALLRRLDDSDPGVRSNAAGALGDLGIVLESMIQALLGQLDDKDLRVRGNVAYALGKLGKTNESIQPLIVQLIKQHQDSENVGSAIDALWQIVEG